MKRFFKTMSEYDTAMKEVSKIIPKDGYHKVTIHESHFRMLEYLMQQGITNIEILKNHLIKKQQYDCDDCKYFPCCPKVQHEGKLKHGTCGDHSERPTP